MENIANAIFYIIDFNKLFNIPNNTSYLDNVYCACNIKSSKKHELKLNFSSVMCPKVL